MPRINIGQKSATGTLQQFISDRIRKDQVVPIISHVIGCDLVFGEGQHKKVVEAYAQQVDYDSVALAGQLELPDITQYIGVMQELVADREGAKEYYLNFVKSWLYKLAETGGVPAEILAEVDAQFDDLTFAKLANRLGYPSFDQGRQDPLLVLADLPLSIYVTTCQHYFIEMALIKAKKEPRTRICPWRDGLLDEPFFLTDEGQLELDKKHQPSPNQPLVYHLHGFDQFPNSLVLTEDDFLEFLVAISRDKGRNTDPIPPKIREALVQSSLMLLGFHLRSWDFKTLFWGLIKTDFKRDYRSISVQLDPEEIDEKYLQSYLKEANFDVYRGTIYQYVQELRRGLEGS